MSERRAFVVVLVALVVVLWAARGILAPFIVSGGIAYAFAPVLTAAEHRTRWPRPVIVALGYVVVLAAVAALTYVAAGQVGHELTSLSNQGPDLVASALRQLVHADTVVIAGSTLSVTDLAAGVHSAVVGVFNSPKSAIEIAGIVVDVALQTVLVLIVTFYLLVDGPRIRDWTLGLVPATDRARTGILLGKVQQTLSRWLRGQLLLIALVAVVAYLFLGPILHIPNALAIGVLTGILEIIPLVGPIIAAVIAMTAALVAGGPGLAVIVGVGYLVIRQVEDQVVMPVVVGRAVHLHPVVTIFAVLAGLSIYGVLGGLLGVPIAAALNVVFTDLYRSRHEIADAAGDGDVDESPRGLAAEPNASPDDS